MKKIAPPVPRNAGAQALLFLGLLYVGLRLVRPPLPASVLWMYMALAVLAAVFFISLSEERMRAALAPLQDLARRRELRWLRRASSALVALAAGAWAFGQASPAVAPPAELRVVHPAPPSQIEFRDHTIRIIGLENPLRADGVPLSDQTDSGARLYFSNCFFCHGDKLDGDGPMAGAFNPPPADFTDVGTIAQLQESYLFWRISKGGIGLPRESQPWNSAMPVWEDYLSEEEIWQVILFLYERAGVSPRTWE